MDYTLQSNYKNPFNVSKLLKNLQIFETYIYTMLKGNVNCLEKLLTIV
jgi:hypothetical protein